MNQSQRAQLLITSLLYPAFLGNMTYVAAEALFKQEAPVQNFANVLLIAVLLVHFTFDWLYTHIQNQESGYAPIKSGLDFVIILCLYITLRQAIEPSSPLAGTWPPPLREPVFWLFVAKVCAVLWELHEVRQKKFCELTRLDRIEIGIDLLFAVVYAALGYGLYKAGLPIGDTGKALLTIAILIDIGGYVVQIREHDKLPERLQKA